MNTSALSSISATINGEARLVEKGTPEDKYYREEHLDNNTFSSEEAVEGQGQSAFVDEREKQDGGRGSFIEGEEVRVVVVRITDGRVSDWKGAVRDWRLGSSASGQSNNTAGERLVNGV